MYTADQPANVPGTKSKLYADDSITYAVSPSPEIALRRVQEHIRRLWEYYLKWGLKINSEKSELICFRTASNGGRRAFATRCNNLELKMPDESVVPVKQSVKYLGINFSTRFKFNKHVEMTLRKANYALHLVYPLLRKQNGLSTSTKLLIYKQLIRPIITYACPIWFTISPTAMNKITMFERKVIRICTGLNWNPLTRKYISTKKLYEAAKLTPIDEYMQQLSKKILNNLGQHPNREIQDILEVQLYPDDKYLQILAITSDIFDDIINNEAVPFYKKANQRHFRG